MLSRVESSCSRLGAASFELAKGLSAPRSLVSIFVAAILRYVLYVAVAVRNVPFSLASRYPRTNQLSATASFVNLFVASIPRRQVRKMRTGKKTVHNIGALEAGRIIVFNLLALQAPARAFNITVSLQREVASKKMSFPGTFFSIFF